jgi:hypothetical protein
VNQSYLSEHFTAYSTDRWLAIGTTPGANLATGSLVGEIGRQAAAIAYANDFYLLAAITVVTLPLVLALRSSRAPRPSDRAALAADAGH